MLRISNKIVFFKYKNSLKSFKLEYTDIATVLNEQIHTLILSNQEGLAILLLKLSYQHYAFDVLTQKTLELAIEMDNFLFIKYPPILAFSASNYI